MSQDLDGAVWTVRVGFTSVRPVRSEQHVTHVLVEAPSEIEARTLAAQMVGTQVGPCGLRPHVEMVTSATIVDCLV